MEIVIGLVLFIYERISDCPHYAAVKAYCDARNILSKYYYGKAEYETPKSIIELY